ncbi:MAG: RecX family transcriptional regulator [Chitinophagaceae bacterium]|nr:RecX family transcriptional regulator [Chitinophagaceae bacterium]
MEKLTPQQALNRIRQYCAYQERCHKEVKDKLYSFGLTTPDVDVIISALIAEDYLNEERFAVHFAGGKFRMKEWGKLKIERELKLRQVSNYCIRKALAQIPDEDYEATFRKLADKKKQSIKSEKNIFIRNRKIRDYLLLKGYSDEMIYTYLKSL